MTSIAPRKIAHIFRSFWVPTPSSPPKRMHSVARPTLLRRRVEVIGPARVVRSAMANLLLCETYVGGSAMRQWKRFSLLRPHAIFSATITVDSILATTSSLTPLTTSYLSPVTNAYHAHNTYNCTKKFSHHHLLLHICLRLLCTLFPSVIICWPFTLVLICCMHLPPITSPRIAFTTVYILPYLICILHAHTAHTHTHVISFSSHSRTHKRWIS